RARGRPLDAHRGVAPVASVTRRLAEPFVADADAAGDADARVDDEQLAVIARHETEPGAQTGPVEHAELDARLPQPGDEARLDAAHADPVGEETHAHAARDGTTERVGEAISDLVGAKDVALQHH